MRKVWTGPAVVLAGLMLLSGCGNTDVAKKDSDSGTSKAAESTQPNVEESEVKPEDSAEKVAEPSDVESKAITMDDFAGFLPDDPVDSVELTEAEQQFGSMGPPEEEGNKIEASGFLFAAPVRIKGGDEYVKVDQPGYACPTLADLNGDGKEELIVGQFKQGKMRMYENISTESDSPMFGEEAWITTGSKPAEVPGVW